MCSGSRLWWRELRRPCCGNRSGRLRGRRAERSGKTRRSGSSEGSARLRAEAVTGSSRALWHLGETAYSKKARGPRPVAVTAAEDGTSLLDEARKEARWDSIFFQEFSGSGERIQQQDLGGRLRELLARPALP